MQIERTYHLDVDLAADTGEGCMELAAELATGLPLMWELITVEDLKGTVRFSGSRGRLDELLKRVDPLGRLQVRADGMIETETIGQYARRISGARDDGKY